MDENQKKGDDVRHYHLHLWPPADAWAYICIAVVWVVAMLRGYC